MFWLSFSIDSHVAELFGPLKVPLKRDLLRFGSHWMRHHPCLDEWGGDVQHYIPLC